MKNNKMEDKTVMAKKDDNVAHTTQHNNVKQIIVNNQEQSRNIEQIEPKSALPQEGRMYIQNNQNGKWQNVERKK